MPLVWRIPVRAFPIVAGIAACVGVTPDTRLPDGAEAVVTQALRGARIVEVKFREELEIRLEAGQLRSRRGASLDGVRAVLDGYRAMEVRPLLAVPAERLEALARDAEARSGEPAPDLASWYQVLVPPDTDLDSFVAELAALPEVKHAYPAPSAAPPPGSPPR